ncbi:hypothetical protein L2E82_48038 [Cichorium intybus]|uniref:Uncharacterized protein n=1 Tax=Cichorium intybus TaxID=13427 RepID=A0ACB8YY82_CICIN|nr:hypothetical protein L2E82_48038 [Cichorium intybus]
MQSSLHLCGRQSGSLSISTVSLPPHSHRRFLESTPTRPPSPPVIPTLPFVANSPSSSRRRPPLSFVVVYRLRSSRSSMTSLTEGQFSWRRPRLDIHSHLQKFVQLGL